MSKEPEKFTNTQKVKKNSDPKVVLETTLERTSKAVEEQNDVGA